MKYILTLLVLVIAGCTSNPKKETGIPHRWIYCSRRWNSQNGNCVQRLWDTWSVSLTLGTDSAQKIAEVTRQNIGKKMDIVWEGKVRSSPLIAEELTSANFVIGSLTEEEANNISEELKAIQ